MVSAPKFERRPSKKALKVFWSRIDTHVNFYLSRFPYPSTEILAVIFWSDSRLPCMSRAGLGILNPAHLPEILKGCLNKDPDIEGLSGFRYMSYSVGMKGLQGMARRARDLSINEPVSAQISSTGTVPFKLPPSTLTVVTHTYTPVWRSIHHLLIPFLCHDDYFCERSPPCISTARWRWSGL